MKWLALVCCLALALVFATGAWLLRTSVDAPIPGDDATPAAPSLADSAIKDLDAVRLTGDRAAVDRFVAAQRDAAARNPGDPNACRLAAEALLLRIGLGNQRRGLRVGEPIYADLAPAVAADIDDGLQLLLRARGAGDDTAANHRLEAELLGNRITGIRSALQWTSRIEAALAAAARIDARDPRLHVALGLRQLLAPKWLGHDPAGALHHFEYASSRLPTDERPRVFAAMASWLLHKRQEAIGWLQQAVAINATNVFARAVLVRLQRGEADPFGRDVDDAEVAAGAAPRTDAK